MQGPGSQNHATGKEKQQEKVEMVGREGMLQHELPLGSSELSSTHHPTVTRNPTQPLPSRGSHFTGCSGQ